MTLTPLVRLAWTSWRPINLRRYARFCLRTLKNKNEPIESCRSHDLRQGRIPITAQARPLRFFCALRPFYCLDDCGMAALGRPAGGVAPGVIGLGDTGTLGEQGLHDLDTAAVRGNHQRRHPVLVLGVDRRPGVEKELRRLDLIYISRQVQRCVAKLLLGIELGAALDQNRDDLEVAVDRGAMHPGSSRFVSLVRRAAIGEERFDQTGIVLFRRARHILVVLAERVEIQLSVRRRAAENDGSQYRRSEECAEASVPETLSTLGNGCSLASQSTAASTVTTASPGSAGGRCTMMTGRPSSRAARIFASVAAPPLALQTSTSIAWRLSRWRSSASAKGPRPTITS